jgi:sugar phosphate isomerase/epimerase
MRIGVDSYCYHRFFGEVYPIQRPPELRMSLKQFLRRAVALEVDGVSLESCFMPGVDPATLREVRGFLDDHGLERVYAWGHPLGLVGGGSEEAYEDMLAGMEHAKALGAKVMRIVGSNHRLRDTPKARQLEQLCRRLEGAVKTAEAEGVQLAIENHIDFSDDELLDLVRKVGSAYLGITFDSGNFVRMLVDPVRAAEKLGRHVLATHIKDLRPEKGRPVDAWNFFACTPLGEGVIDNLSIARHLVRAGFDGFLAVEIDYLHRDFGEGEDDAVARSVRELRRIATAAERRT